MWESNLVSGLNLVVETPEMQTRVISKGKTLRTLHHRLTGKFLKLQAKGYPQAQTEANQRPC